MAPTKLIELATLATLLAVLVISCSLAAPNENGGGDQNLSPRGKFSLPKLFDFASYRQLFKKAYASLAEQAIRQRLFLARAARAFVSAIKYKYGLSSEYLKINSRSDWTKEEIAASKLRNVKLFANIPGAYDGAVKTNEQPAAERDQLELVDAEQIESQFKDMSESLAGEPGYAKIVAELNGAGARQRREVRELRQISLDDLIGVPQVGESPEVEAKIVRLPASNNPTYQRPEMESFASAADESGAEKVSPMKTVKYYTVISQNQRQETGEALKSIFSDLAKSLFGGGGSASFNSRKQQDQQPVDQQVLGQSEPNKVFVDHRKSNCFFAPRQQGDCGSCYAFAMVAQLEWMHCRETGNLVPFSEQYILDCGHRSGLMGCDGGDVTHLAEFAYNFGLELRTIYPYKAQTELCPYPDTTEPEKMGYMKLNIGKSAVVPQGSFDEFIKFSPMIVGVATNNTNFDEYGGGVASGAGCGLDEDHAMLLVGHGREEGEEYWLLRNSHSTSFGEEGYYKLAKKAACIRTSGFIFGSIDGREIKMSPQVNELYNEQLIKEKKSVS